MSDTLAALSDGEIKNWFDTVVEPDAQEFQLALVLGGTASAGCYTAGVLDFLIEALDRWMDGPAGAKNYKPPFRVTVKFVTGTSGGGVNAAILSRALAYEFPPVSRGTPMGIAAQNPFYDTWVNQLTLDSMLTLSDLEAPRATPVSILNGEGVDDAADKVVAFTGAVKARAWVGSPLRVFLTLTNLNGMPYKIDFSGAGGAWQQSYVDHADFARFAVVYPGRSLGVYAPGAAPRQDQARPDEFSLGFDNARLPNPIQWGDFKEYACGTAAIPVGLPPRALSRPLSHYRYRIVAVPGEGTAGGSGMAYKSLVPDVAAIQEWGGSGGGLPASYRFLAVDGGVTDNEPIELARTALAGISGRNPRDGAKAHKAVLLVDPFAGSARMTDPFPPTLLPLAGAALNTFLQQTRYDTRDIVLASDPEVFSRFMISAQRSGVAAGDAALATSGLGALVGFASDVFRRHDYLLGRKNCQDFLRSVFVLPVENTLFDGWRDTAAARPFVQTVGDRKYLPIVPLLDDCAVPETLDPWPVDALDPEVYRAAIEARFDKLLAAQFDKGPLSDILAWLAGKAAQTSAADYIIGRIKAALPQPTRDLSPPMA